MKLLRRLARHACFPIGEERRRGGSCSGRRCRFDEAAAGKLVGAKASIEVVDGLLGGGGGGDRHGCLRSLVMEEEFAGVCAGMKALACDSGSGRTGGFEPGHGMLLSIGEDEIASRVVTARRSTSGKHSVSENMNGTLRIAAHEKTLVGETKVGHPAADRGIATSVVPSSSRCIAYLTELAPLRHTVDRLLKLQRAGPSAPLDKVTFNCCTESNRHTKGCQLGWWLQERRVLLQW